MFHTYVGVGIKWIILRYRLLAATQLAIQPDTQSWTKIAAELGYTDQSHFINDFKRIIGKTPNNTLSNQENETNNLTNVAIFILRGTRLSVKPVLKSKMFYKSVAILPVH